MTTDSELDRLLAPRIAAKVPPKILTLDIERLPGQANISFWGLGDYAKGRRIHADDVTEWPRTICFAYRWYGNRRVDFSAEWLEEGYVGMLRKAWDLYHQADIVVGHNLGGFDSKKLASEWQTQGWSPPSPWKTVDTLKVARSSAGHESNTLDALLKRLGVQGKTDKYSVEVARLACAGDKAAQRKIRLYNQGDVVASEALYDHLRPWMTNHPAIGLWSGEDRSCGNCGGVDLEPSGWARTAVTAYAQYLCKNCGAWWRANHIKARVSVRASR